MSRASLAAEPPAATGGEVGAREARAGGGASAPTNKEQRETHRHEAEGLVPVRCGRSPALGWS